MQDDSKNILEHLSEDADTFLFVSKNPLVGFDVLCFEKSSIEYIIKDKNNWLYECTGPIKPTLHDPNAKSAGIYDRETYVKLPNDETGLNAFIPLIQLKKILKRNHKIYYIEFEKDITHSIGWKNSFGPSRHANWVGANHCQGGSNILLYTLKVCRDPVRCIKSLSEWGRVHTNEPLDDEEDDEEEDDEEEDDQRDEQQAQQEEREQAEFEQQSELARLQLQFDSQEQVYDSDESDNERDYDSDESDHDRDPRDYESDHDRDPRDDYSD